MTCLSKIGMSSLCLLLLCACSPKVAVRTEVVKVPTPVYIALPKDLLRPCIVDMPGTWTNGTLVEYAIGLQACVAASNDKLTRIKKLQPKESR